MKQRKILHPKLDPKARNKPAEKREGGAVLEITNEGSKWGYRATDRSGAVFYELHPVDWTSPQLAVQLGIKQLLKQGISRDAMIRVKYGAQQPILRLSEALQRGFWKALQGGSYEAT